jgi:hypothetical protein
MTGATRQCAFDGQHQQSDQISVTLKAAQTESQYQHRTAGKAQSQRASAGTRRHLTRPQAGNTIATTKETASMRSRAGYDPSPKHVFTSNPGILYTWLALLASSTLLERVTRVTHDTQLLSSFSAPSPRMTSYFTSDHPQYTHITFHAPCSQSDGFQ